MQYAFLTHFNPGLMSFAYINNLSGSGKTLAYLLPIMECILNYKETHGSQPNRPFCIIVVPSRELGHQINASV